jgi:N-acetylmuramoyl-L-alanine amidase
MRRILILPVAAALAAALAPTALGSAAPRVVELPARDDRSGITRSSVDGRFTLVGVHWRGPGRVQFRTRSVDGTWSRWRDAAPEAEDGPDPGSVEATRQPGWRVGNPWWVGRSDRLETRTVGRVTRVRAHLVWSPESRVPYRAPAATSAPLIVPRLSWGADESIRRGPPTYAPALRFAVVHHTAGGNDYSRAEAAAVVRGIQLYHVRGNGWNDIGYNFLVDRFGTIYEGRYGGVERNVVGAHALGFNSGSVGIALLGTYGSAAPSRAAQDALARLVAWRLDLAHVDPTAFTTTISAGSEKYARGLPVLLRSVSGHRDTGYTECPGNLLFARLNEVARAATAIGLPKVYEPRADASGRLFRIRARLSSALSWTASIVAAAGAEVAVGTGTGASVDWTWDATGVPPGRYTWSVRAGPARPATGSIRIGGTEAPSLEDVSAEPESISPNGDGQADVSVVSYRLTAPMNMTVEITDVTGGVVATLVDRVWTPAGTHTVEVDGRGLVDGDYHVALTARTAVGAEIRKIVPLHVSRTLGLVAVTPTAFSPNGDGRRDLVRISFTLAAAADVQVRVFRESQGVVALFFSSQLLGVQEVTWNGLRASGPVRDGLYTALVEARDAFGTARFAAPFVLDTTAPVAQVVSGRPLRVRVSEPAALVLRVDGTTIRRQVASAGVVRVPWDGTPAGVRVVAWDGAGNRSPLITWAPPRGRSAPRE